MTILAGALAALLAGASPAPPSVDLEIDRRVPEEFVRLLEKRIIDDDSLDAWLDLPGNAELFRQGAVRGELTREELRENLWNAILGHASRRGHGLGSLAFDPPGDLIRMLDEITAREPEIRQRVADRVAAYLPADAPPIRAVVRLHLGGTWDGRTRDDIYMNLTFLHGYTAPWFAGIEGILAHELTHIVHRQFDGPPEDATTPEGLFAVALAQIHSEGIARHVESGLLAGPYPQGSYAAFVEAKHRDDLAGFTTALRHTEDLRTTCLELKDALTCRRLIQTGLWRGGETYVVGQGMARAIEAALGRGTLASSFASGGAGFFRLYVQATKMLPDLPHLSDAFEATLPAADAYLAAKREAWRLRRDARAAFARSDYAAAEVACRKVTDLDPADPIAAYNLACALSRRGNESGALEWIERSMKLGYTDREHMAADPDLDPLRHGKSYGKFLELIGTAKTPQP